jgi:hypothetical protein
MVLGATSPTSTSSPGSATRFRFAASIVAAARFWDNVFAWLIALPVLAGFVALDILKHGYRSDVPSAEGWNLSGAAVGLTFAVAFLAVWYGIPALLRGLTSRGEENKSGRDLDSAVHDALHGEQAAPLGGPAPPRADDGRTGGV